MLHRKLNELNSNNNQRLPGKHTKPLIEAPKAQNNTPKTPVSRNSVRPNKTPIETPKTLNNNQRAANNPKPKSNTMDNKMDTMIATPKVANKMQKNPSSTPQTPSLTPKTPNNTPITPSNTPKSGIDKSKILNGVCAYVDVQARGQDRSDVVIKKILAIGK